MMKGKEQLPYSLIQIRKEVEVIGNFFIEWFHENGRNFPWRQPEVGAFSILVTEFMLRQARAENVATTWNGFLSDFPNPQAIVLIQVQELEDRLRPLGLANQKANSLLQACNHLIKEFDGEVPRTKKELLEIPHVGIYSANAIQCFAFGERVEIVDTNILRFIARLFGIPAKLDIRRNPVIWEIAKDMLPGEDCSTQAHNYGLLDFTASICKARTPVCANCFFSLNCIHARSNIHGLRNMQTG